MDDIRLNVLCDELRGLANGPPGVNPTCAQRVRAIAHEIQRSVDAKGTSIGKDASEINEGFELWFSPRKWKQLDDDGQQLKSHIFASILKLEGDVSQIHGSRANGAAKARLRLD
jgi:hypothetical protein